jgi:hypothetical protein
MGFRCEVCKVAQEPRTKAKKVPIQFRKVSYPPIKDENDRVIRVPEGYEIVKEVVVCPVCYEVTRHG